MRKIHHKELESHSSSMKGETPPPVILDSLNMAIRYRRETNAWFENNKQGSRVSRNAHVEWTET